MSLTLTFSAEEVARYQAANAALAKATRAVAALPFAGSGNAAVREALELAKIERDLLARQVIASFGCGQTLDEIVAEHEASLT